MPPLSLGLILDLRGNPGGLIRTLERLVGHFLGRDLKIAHRKGRKVKKPMMAKTRWPEQLNSWV